MLPEHEALKGAGGVSCEEHEMKVDEISAEAH